VLEKNLSLIVRAISIWLTIVAALRSEEQRCEPGSALAKIVERRCRLQCQLVPQGVNRRKR
jgi:hypothetical protein